jgi:hypothetical protein
MGLQGILYGKEAWLNKLPIIRWWRNDQEVTFENDNYAEPLITRRAPNIVGWNLGTVLII